MMRRVTDASSGKSTSFAEKRPGCVSRHFLLEAPTEPLLGAGARAGPAGRQSDSAPLVLVPADRRQCPGLTPTVSLKAVAKWLWLEYPHARAISAIE